MSKVVYLQKKAMGYRLRHWREERGSKEPRTFWPRFGLSPARMRNYELGQRAPRLITIVEICQKTGLSPDYWLCGR